MHMKYSPDTLLQWQWATSRTTCVDLLGSDVFYLDEYKNGLPGLNVNLISTSFSLDISEKPDRYQEADRGSAFLFHAISDGNSN